MDIHARVLRAPNVGVNGDESSATESHGHRREDSDFALAVEPHEFSATRIDGDVQERSSFFFG